MLRVDNNELKAPTNIGGELLTSLTATYYVIFLFGGPGWYRTTYTKIFNLLLYHLSYWSMVTIR